MLGDANVMATIAVKDIEQAKKFYGDTLGLKIEKENEGGVSFTSGSSRLFAYPSQYAGTNQATYASWTVQDIDEVVSDLKGKGVQFEHYPDMPQVTLQGDIHVMGDTFKAAWFKDPDGNILALDNGME